ncbi:type II toxin-antitoxin system antitoxin SocA domain-containing protein [Escherichia sp. E3356]|uniref:Panacea domain-containing protein n=1 Tax=Escherichia sp. E3356 TaxID=2044461 RepID=UPI001F11516F|nr:type II toxin-antitoxin system antitoxin SocA domain-containing protein [Escherichia sp. E3356]
MAYSAAAVANAFIEKALKGKLKNLTPMKLQKLLFYTQSWHLKLRDNTPLFDDLFARWKFGPVIPPLYHMLKKYGANEITEKISVILECDGELKRNHPYNSKR